jgi:hypothetical protein
MAIRQTVLQSKRSTTPNQALPSLGSIKQGEAVVNLSDGILFFSGVTGSYTESDNGTSGYFEVGSNLYDLNLRNKIIGYGGITNLSGKFLSGTTSGFTLANISDIAGVDTNTYVTGFTWDPNQLTISRNDGLPDLVVSLDTFSGLTVTGDVDIQGDISNSTGDVTIQDNLLVNGNLTITGTTSGIEHNGLDGLQGGSGGEYYHTTQVIHGGLTASTNPSNSNPFATIADIAAASGDTQQVKVSNNDTTPGFLEDKLSGGTNISITTINDGGNEFIFIDTTHTIDTNTYATGNSNTTSSTNGSVSYTTDLTYNNDLGTGTTYTLNLEDTFVTGGTLNGSNLVLHKNDGSNTSNIDLSSLDVNDTFATGFTYDNSNNLTVSLNNGTDLVASINTVTGMTNTGNLDLQGELGNSTGNVTINDNLDITGTTTSWGDILPGTHLGYKLGESGRRWDELWVRKIQIGTTTTTIEDDESNMTMSGNSGNFIFRPAVDTEFHSDILPGSDLGYSLGIPSQRWDNIYAGDINATGLTISNLGANRVVYTDGSGTLSTESGFEYDASSDLLTVGDLNVTNTTGNPAIIGQGGLVIGAGGSPGDNPGVGDLVIHGNFTVYGTGTTIDTTELYIEDPTITLNYNPTGDTSTTSIGSGFIIQDGAGTSGNDAFLAIAQMNTFTGGDVTEYSGPTGVTNRSWFTELNDIVIRNTNTNSGAPDGKRVLVEDDCLDGGLY